MSAIQQMLLATADKVVQGQQAYITPGTYSWVCPAGVTSVSVVVVGPGSSPSGSRGGAGGGLAYKNNIPVTPGSSYTVVVGSSGTDSYFISTSTIKGGASAAHIGGTYLGDGGGNGGDGGTPSAGGGAGGYTGNGGRGGISGGAGPQAGTGGGGGGGVQRDTGSGNQAGGGGGVGLLGLGTDGAAGTGTAGGGGGGSGGTAGEDGISGTAAGGSYGGGGGRSFSSGAGPGRTGAVRIVWPGLTRQFPSTNVQDV